MIVDAETPLGPRPVPPSRDDEPSHGLRRRREERAWQAIIAGFDAPAVDPHRRSDPRRAGPDLGAGGRSRRPAAPAGRRRRPTSPAGSASRRPPGRPSATTSSSTRGATRETAAGAAGGPAAAGRRRRRCPSGKDLDKAADARARHEAEAAREDAEDLWIDGPPTPGHGRRGALRAAAAPAVPAPVPQHGARVLLVVIGVLLIAIPQVIGLDDRTGMTLGVLAVLSGGVLLVLRLREARDEDGPDDGAVV